MTEFNPNHGWQFWIDRGGTFTDIVARHPDGQLTIHKLLSENPERYADAPVQGIRDILGIAADAPVPAEQISAVKMGTTVATNALLERQGDRTVLVITKGFRHALRIGYQNRPDIFARQIILPEMLYEQVIEVEERFSARGEELIPLAETQLIASLQESYNAGIRSCAIAFMHGYRYSDHEKQAAIAAREVGFTQVSVSHEVSPLMKLVSRGDTTVADAYLSPILRRYVDRVASQLGSSGITPPIQFMQSNGGLADAQKFQGKDSILSGPAGGIVGAVQTSLIAGFNKIITFDMGGTSTDVAHFASADGTVEYERTFETEVAGVRLRTPMMAIHTVAAGGGSILQFDGARYRVGPESAGANPGPASYSKGGPLTVTDCNVMVGKLQPEFFPKVFGSNGDLPLDAEVVQQKFTALAAEIGNCTPERVATGFLAIAVEKMASAIKKISLQRGYDVSEYTLCCFGGAGGQHACLIADALGMKQVFIHPYAGVLSAYGMGLADVRVIREQAVEQQLSEEIISHLEQLFAKLEIEARKELQLADTEISTAQEAIQVYRKLHLHYEGTDSSLIVDYGDRAEIREQFEHLHRQRYGFVVDEKPLIVEAVSVEVVSKTDVPDEPLRERGRGGEGERGREGEGERGRKINNDCVNESETLTPPVPEIVVRVYTSDAWHETPLFQREDLQPGDSIAGPAIVVEATGTNVIEPGWQAEISDRNHLILKRSTDLRSSIVNRQSSIVNRPDPVTLEIFNNLFRAIAEEMGITLQNTSSSVNIKERLDFSCAIFDAAGQLVANAPHIPVHLGSMSESVTALIAAKGNIIKPGDVYILNNPYNGGTHLPDITVITPVFNNNWGEHGGIANNRGEHGGIANNRGEHGGIANNRGEHGGIANNRGEHGGIAPTPSRPLFYVASRGHHADIGGITPGSMPPNSVTVEQEGVLIDNFQLVSEGTFRERELLELLSSGKYPARNPAKNIADLQAQIAANERGLQELHNTIAHYGLDTVRAYMGFVQDNAEESVRRVIDILPDGSFTCPLDNGSAIQVTIAIAKSTRSARIDFTGTSPQLESNFNAPAAVCKAAVLYVFRTLVNDDIPLNAGCLKPLEIIIPEGCMLNPRYPAAVVAGNVETSQAITDALYGALGVMAASQGTMNNFTFGSDRYQYYETICGGSGAGADFDGTDAVQTHMTNSRLTDPEVLEWRFPVLLESFAIRPNSGGKGHHHGGNGVIRRLRFLEPMTAGILSGRRLVPPFGLQGGEAGAVGKNWVERNNGTVEKLGSTAVVQMQPGDVFVIETPGGGSYGEEREQGIGNGG